MLHPEPLEGNVFNVGTGERIDLVRLVDVLNSILKRDLRPIFAEERQGDVKHSQACLKRIGSVLGYRPEVNFEEGLRRTVEAEIH